MNIMTEIILIHDINQFTKKISKMAFDAKDILTASRNKGERHDPRV